MTDIPATGSSPLLLQVLYDAETELGQVTLRKRRSIALERDVFEMTVDDKLMMSSAIVESEQALAQQGLAALSGEGLHVLIGGLGFGFTAQAALADRRVSKVAVIERLAPVVEWHRTGVFPWSAAMLADPRLEIIAGDFFAAMRDEAAVQYDAILIDIDDSPSLLWHESHADFYEPSALHALQRHLRPGGVLALWFAADPEEAFVDAAKSSFATAELIAIDFENPSLRQPETNYILVARKGIAE